MLGIEEAEEVTHNERRRRRDVAEVGVKETEPGDAGKNATAIETALKGNIWLKRNKGTEIYVEFKKKIEYFEKRRLA